MVNVLLHLPLYLSIILSSISDAEILSTIWVINNYGFNFWCRSMTCLLRITSQQPLTSIQFTCHTQLVDTRPSVSGRLSAQLLRGSPILSWCMVGTTGRSWWLFALLSMQWRSFICWQTKTQFKSLLMLLSTGELSWCTLNSFSLAKVICGGMVVDQEALLLISWFCSCQIVACFDIKLFVQYLQKIGLFLQVLNFNVLNSGE